MMHDAIMRDAVRRDAVSDARIDPPPTTHYPRFHRHMPRVLEEGIHVATPPRKWRVDLVLQRLALVGVIVGVWWLLSLKLPHFILPGP